MQLAAGDDVEAGSARRQQLENGERGVGFYRVADQVVAARKRFLKKAEALNNLAG